MSGTQGVAADGADTVDGVGALPGVGTVLRRWSWVLAGSMVGLCAGLGAGFAIGSTYESTVYLTVSSSVDQDDGSAARAAQGLARLATGPGVVGAPLAAAGLDWSAAEIRDHVRVQAAPDAPLVSITASGDTPSEAQTAAEVVGRALAGVRDLGAFDARVAAEAPLPDETVVPAWLLPAGGLALGLGVGIVAAAVVPAGGPSRPGRQLG